MLDNQIENVGQDIELTIDIPLTLNDGIGLLSLVSVGEGMLIRRPKADEKITVRFNVSGLSCKPYGSVHTRKLKDLFKLHNIAPWLRSRTPLIYYNESLVAVAGLFVCEEAAILSANEQSLFIDYKTKSACSCQ